MTKLVVLCGVAGLTLCTAWLDDRMNSSALPESTPAQAPDFEQYPPYATRFWLQLLSNPLGTGENLIFRVQYESDSLLPQKITLYGDGGTAELQLRDDGIAPDKVAGDKQYATYKKEDVNLLMAGIRDAEGKLKDKKRFLEFTGHLGQVVRYEDLVKFDETSFRAYKEVEVSIHLKAADTCEPELLKERSLLITDLAIVEDHGRTYNVVTGIGNPTGAWTFGTLMANIENGQYVDGLRGFLKEWIRLWTTPQTVGAYSDSPREEVYEHLIRPWLAKANNLQPEQIDIGAWEETWDNTPESALRASAPFKLTAIVNRLDLRGNSAYALSPANAGETRFIYTLINPFTGAIPIHRNQTALVQQNGVGFIDWRGMNLIVEYGNPQTTRCEQRDLAESWLALSDPALYFGSAESNNPYKDALQAITDLVTSPNVAPSKVNGSALNRLRTNEKLFDGGDGTPGLSTEDVWELADWEFRQFELSASTHGLVMTPLTNTPDHTANYAPNIQETGYTGQPVSNEDVIDWVFNGHRNLVLHGNFNLPAELLSGASRVRREESQYFDFEPKHLSTAGGYAQTIPSPQAKAIRHQISVNTCSGCHNGETKTVFTHVNALAYGESSIYWQSTLDGASGLPQDPFFYPWGDATLLHGHGLNQGVTTDLINTGLNFTTDDEVQPRHFFQSVSPFLTGRRYSDYLPELQHWQDDEREDENLNVEFGPDNTMDGLFIVNDPSNNGDAGFPFASERQNGFNDLARRRDAMCQFINQPCQHGLHKSMMQWMAELTHIPLPKGGH